MSWYGKTLQSNVNAAVNYYLKQKFPKYTDLDTGTDYFLKSDVKFPYVRIYLAEGEEVGQTFDNGVNAVKQMYQIDVFTNNSESTCREIADYVAEILSKNMDIVQQPTPLYSDVSVYRYTLRARWTIGANNTVKW